MAGEWRTTRSEDVLLIAVQGGSIGDTILLIAGWLIFGLLVVGGIRIQDPGPDDPINVAVAGLFGIWFLGVASYWGYHSLVYGETPFIFDRRIGQLRRGPKPLCQLSEIRQVRIFEERGEYCSYYTLSLILADSRRVGFGPFLKFGEQGAASRKKEIEAFLKIQAPDLTKSPDGAYDPELDG